MDGVLPLVLPNMEIPGKHQAWRANCILTTMVLTFILRKCTVSFSELQVAISANDAGHAWLIIRTFGGQSHCFRAQQNMHMQVHLRASNRKRLQALC